MMMGGKKSFGWFWPLLDYICACVCVCFVKRTGPVHSVSFSCYLLFLWEYIWLCAKQWVSNFVGLSYIYIQMKAAILSKITKTSHSHIEQWTLDGSRTIRVIFYIALIKEMARCWVVYAWKSMAVHDKDLWVSMQKTWRK